MSNKAQVVIHGKTYPQVGRICMDQIMVNIEQDSAFNGDEVILIGQPRKGKGSLWRNWPSGRIRFPYEILTNINTRVPRVYNID